MEASSMSTINHHFIDLRTHTGTRIFYIYIYICMRKLLFNLLTPMLLIIGRELLNLNSKVVC